MPDPAESLHNDESGERSSASSDVGALVGAAQGGDRQAFGALYQRYARVVAGVLLAHAPPDEVPDLVQEVFLHALKKIGALREPGAFGAWVTQIARNMARMKHRKEITLVPIDEQMPSTPDAGDSSDLDGATVLAAIQSLPDAYRESLVLRLVEGMSGQQIAEHTGLTAGSVRVNLHRGMLMLRQKLGGLR